MPSGYVPNDKLRRLYLEYSDEAPQVGPAQFVRVEGVCGPKAGARLKLIREMRGFDVKYVARRANLEEAELERLESNPTEADISALTSVCQALGVSLAELSNQVARYVDPGRVLEEYEEE